MRLFILLLVWVVLTHGSCVEDAECPSPATCEVGICVNNTCDTNSSCTCGNGILEEPWEECDGGGLCSMDCERLGACLYNQGGQITCEDYMKSSNCSTQQGFFVIDAECLVETACCDRGECSLELPAICYGLQGRPRGNTTCADPDLCLAGCCCASGLLYGQHRGALPVFFASECCLLQGKMLEDEKNCSRLGYDPIDDFPLVCDYGACWCPGALGTRHSKCKVTTRAECACEFTPLETCETNTRCGLICSLLIIPIALGPCLLACCCGAFCPFLIPRRSKEEEKYRKLK